MSIIISEPDIVDFPTHPEGQFAGVCIDIIEHWQVETRYGTKDRIQLRFFTGERGAMSGAEKSEIIDVYADAFFTRSFHPESNLRKFLEAWRGKKFTEEERKSFDLERLLHANALLQISHNEQPEKTYANIVAVMPLPKAMDPVIPPDDYVRMKDREDHEGNGHGHHAPAAPEPDDDLPF